MKNSNDIVSGLSRRNFLSGVFASFGAGALGGRVFAAPSGWSPKKKPNLIFGILSDTHLMVEWNRKSVYRTMTLDYIRNAFKLFKNCNVDAFVHLGDASHRGAVREWEFHTEVFEDVFGKSGGPVKVIVVGNHELFGGCDRIKKMWPDPAQWRENAICGDLPRHYERVWGEPFAEVFHKEVKGYHFFGRHWETPEQKLADYINGKAGAFSLVGKKPFFVLSHKRTHFRCNASLKKFPNAIGFCGHWHSSTANWTNIHYDDFGGFYPIINCGACRFDGENGLNKEFLRETPAPQRDKKTNRFQFPSRQAMIVNVFDDMVVFEKHEVGVGGKIGPDWIMPMEVESWKVGKSKVEKLKVGEREGRASSRPHPFSREELKKSIGAPEFPKGAKLAVGRVAPNAPRGGLRTSRPTTSNEPLRISIPLANGNPTSRIFAYNVRIAGNTDKLFKSVFFQGVNSGIGHEPNNGVTTLEIPAAELPSGRLLTISVRPISSLGTRGKIIETKYRV